MFDLQLLITIHTRVGVNVHTHFKKERNDTLKKVKTKNQV